MPNIFEYDDYRAFLNDLYREKKAGNHGFSYQMVSLKAGFRSKSFLHAVMAGKKELTPESASRVAAAFGLAETDAAYFRSLVAFNQALEEHKEAMLERLDSIRTRRSAQARAKKLRRDQYEYYSTWYHPAVRALIDMHAFSGDFRRLAGMLTPPITVPQARKSVELLLRLGLIEQTTDGEYVATDKVLTTGRQVRGVAVKRYHTANMRLAQEALDTLPSDQRNVSSLTLGISEQCYRSICDMVYELQDKILEKVGRETNPERVYQLNFQLFPLSKRDSNRRSE
jgi:uncharacterized protein (TIGR02147 family)